eukprot:9928420-Ditylum_brightwellii.AAC.1
MLRQCPLMKPLNQSSTRMNFPFSWRGFNPDRNQQNHSHLSRTTRTLMKWVTTQHNKSSLQQTSQQDSLKSVT